MVSCVEEMCSPYNEVSLMFHKQVLVAVGLSMSSLPATVNLDLRVRICHIVEIELKKDKTTNAFDEH